MIEVSHLTKRYPGRTAVDDVSFSVKEREIVGFLGPNGAGKSTTMRVIAGYLPPTSAVQLTITLEPASASAPRGPASRKRWASSLTT